MLCIPRPLISDRKHGRCNNEKISNSSRSDCLTAALRLQEPRLRKPVTCICHARLTFCSLLMLRHGYGAEIETRHPGIYHCPSSFMPSQIEFLKWTGEPFPGCFRESRIPVGSFSPATTPGRLESMILARSRRFVD